MAYNSQYAGAEIDAGISLARTALQPSNVKNNFGTSTGDTISQNFSTTILGQLSQRVVNIINGNTHPLNSSVAANTQTASTITGNGGGVLTTTFSTPSVTQFSQNIIAKRIYIGDINVSSEVATPIQNLVSAGNTYEFVMNHGPTCKIKIQNSGSVEYPVRVIFYSEPSETIELWHPEYSLLIQEYSAQNITARLYVYSSSFGRKSDTISIYQIIE